MVFLFVFLSGFAGLVYEVLWMKQLGLLFGNTSQAAGATLAAFFGGLAVGSWLWGARASKIKNPLRAYAWLEVGIAVTALLYFLILHGYHAIYPSLYQNIASAHGLLLAKFGLAMVLVFPPAVFMGGTIPVMGQVVISKQADFGRLSALLYGVNTLGAGLGAFLAGFFFPLWFGFNLTCVLAMCVTGGIAALAFVLSRGGYATPNAPEVRPAWTNEAALSSTAEAGTRRINLALTAVCFLSGFGVLALEVLWTRMFSQVVENSVYTFAAILVTVLICLATGALISNRLARLAWSPLRVLAVLMLVSGVAVALTPYIFMHITDDLQVLASRGSWPSYIQMIFEKCFMAIGLPACTLGVIFPYLMKTGEARATSAGRTLGRLAAINTAGAILGSLLCGFIFLERFGMWRTMQMLSMLYLAMAVVLPLAWDRKSAAVRVLALLALLSTFSFLNPTELPVSSIDPKRQGEVRLETWEGSDCTVAVVRDPYGLSIKVNSHYGLGSTAAYMQETLQTTIPLLAYPQTKSIFFLGVGTGITAGGALDAQFSNVTRIVSCELVPEVITAAKKYMTNVDGFDVTGGLFTDPRSTVLAEDGRHYLMATQERFDMVNADLFVPYRSGAGSLYSKEHYESVRERLEPGGVIFQWLPLYQLTENEFAIIARTMLEVFDQVSLWRNNFQVGEEVVALVGHKDATPLPACIGNGMADRQTAVAGKNHRDLQRLMLPFNSQTISFFYCGNVTKAKALFADYPVNTDDKPMIEYLAPRTYRNITDTAIPWFVGPRLARTVEAIQRLSPPENDPLLVNRSAADRRLPLAGAAFHRARIWEVIGDEPECARAWRRFTKDWLDQ
jgi:spermidine synthase